MPKNSLDKGLGRSVRDTLSGGTFGRPTPVPQMQNPMFYVGIVMDDSDDQGMGRVWVYLPRHSSKRFGLHSTPDYGGTAPDRETGRLVPDPELRTGWIVCYPLLPFAGTDFSRVSSSPTGRNGREGGYSNSYGFWCQPRIGDHVGILFDHSDPSQGYWIGMVPRFYSNFSMPGVSGVQKSTISEELNAQFYETLPDDALIPALERINEEGASQRFRDLFAATDFTNNLLVSGLISDPLRGASVSSARRESPSYVVGMKSPGWDFDSEKNNYNISTNLKFDGTPVGFPPTTGQTTPYQNVATVGHQFVMDDHPDYQGVRLRTSAGSQIYFNDTSAAEPFIYISTAKGSVWMEFRDDGKLDVFAEDDISFHAQGDMNFVADGDMNFEAGNIRTLVKGNHEMQVTGTTSWEMAQDFSISAKSSMNIDVIGSFLQNSSDETAFGAAGGTFYIASDGTMNFNTQGSIRSTCAGYDVRALLGLTLESGSGITLNGGGEVRAQAGAIWLNSGGGPPALPATGGPGPTLVPFSQPTTAPGAPSEAQIISGEYPGTVTTIASRLPQHQPWTLRSANTRGFNGFVEESEEDPTSPQGAATDEALTPLSFVGYFGGEDQAKAFKGKEYETGSLAEEPQYDVVRDPLPDELKEVDGLQASDRLVKFLHSKEGLVIRYAYLDAGVAWAIGYGHNIKIGDIINGTLSEGGRSTTGQFRVNADFISTLNRTKGLGLSITKEEAERIFRVDLQKFEDAIRRNVQVDITQGQFDALVSITYNIGEGNLIKSTFLRKINERRFEEVPRNWLVWRKSRNSAGQLVVNEGLQRRRQEELELFWAASDEQIETTA